LSLKIGILGGTFNPIHYGHLAAAEEVRDRLKLDRILFIPSYLPPHKLEEDVPSAAERMEMVRLAISGNDHFEPSDLEIKRGGTSYTIDTIKTLRQTYADAELFFITGLDTFLEIQTWHDWETLLTLCCFVVLSRPGYCFADMMKIDFMRSAEKELTALDRGAMRHAVIGAGAFTVVLETVPLYDISSTGIRERVKEGRSIKYHLPEAVEIYIMKQRLYA
jgi:nicotinate-nucleotide adenylyltransferase